MSPLLPKLWVGFTLVLSSALYAADAEDPDKDYDRLDGRGKSGKKVHVIEWEGNLEIHVTPAGSLKGLGLTLDKKNKDKPVMVISYRFDNDPGKTLIRRAILGIPISENFQTFRDLSADDYDKIIISNNGLAITKTLVAFKLDAEPKQLYPDGHPALLAAEEEKSSPKGSARAPSSDLKPANWNLDQQRAKVTTGTMRSEDDSGGSVDVDSGTIRPFRW